MGGNNYFTAGAIRMTHDGLEDLRPMLDDLSDKQAAATELDPYTSDNFIADMWRVTEGRCDPDLTRTRDEFEVDMSWKTNLVGVEAVECLRRGRRNLWRYSSENSVRLSYAACSGH